MRPSSPLYPLIAGGLLAGLFTLSAQGSLVQLDTSNGVGSSWDTATAWADDLVPNGGLLNPTDDYVVGSGFLARSPGSASPTFSGQSLTLENGGELRLKHSGTAIIDNFVLENGEVNIGNGGTLSMGGTMTIGAAGGIITGDGSSLRGLNYTGTLAGSGPLTVGEPGNVTRLIVGNTGNTYSGTVTVAQDGQLDVNYINSFSGTANLLSGGKVYIDGNQTFEPGTLKVEGVDVPGGFYTFDTMSPALQANFLPNNANNGTLTVGQNLLTSQAAGDNWNDAGYWTDGVGAVAGTHYSVVGGRIVRSPEGVTPSTFAGESLTVNNAILRLKGANGGSAHIENLVVWNGEVNNGANNASSTLTGNLEIVESAEFSGDGDTRTLTVEALVSGQGDITVDTGTGTFLLTFANAANTWTGNITVTDGATLDFNYAYEAEGWVDVLTDGFINLDQNLFFDSSELRFDGVPLEAGVYDFADLTTAGVSSYFVDGGVGSLVTVVPEPSTLALLISGMALTGLGCRRRSRAA